MWFRRGDLIRWGVGEETHEMEGVVSQRRCDKMAFGFLEAAHERGSGFLEDV
jgi:hypothetical protein